MKKDKIRSMYKACSAEITSRTNEISHLLLGEGNFDAQVMIIGEVPSAKEEEYNQNILEGDRDKISRLLSPLNLTIEDVYFTHLMKYRPYRINTQGRIVSRSPEKEELAFFIPYLEKEISLIAPKLIITLGKEPLRSLSKDESIVVNSDEDQILVIGVLGKSYKLYPIHHPASTNFMKSLNVFLERDVERCLSILNEGSSGPGKKFSNSKKNNNLQHETNQSISRDDNNDTNQQTNQQTNQRGNQEDHLNSEDRVHQAEEGKARIFDKIKLSGKKDGQKDGQKGKRTSVTMVYGGEGYVDDPVLIALERISHVLTELDVGIHRIDLHKGTISMQKALEYIQESKGVILAVNVEWYGIGYRMQQFLDECFMRGDEIYFKDIPLYGVCFTRHAFEREAYQHLLSSFEYLGGIEGIGLLASIKNAAQLETNFDWLYGIDKKTEAYFRLMQQEKGHLPVSYKADKVLIEMPVNYPAFKVEEAVYKQPKHNPIIEDYDSFVEKQQQDIQNISSLFKKKLSLNKIEADRALPQIFKESYKGMNELKATLQIIFEDLPRENTVIELNNKNIRSYYGQQGDVTVTVTGQKEILNRIFSGKLTMQRAFMTGEVKAKGDFTILYKFEELFDFS